MGLFPFKCGFPASAAVAVSATASIPVRNTTLKRLIYIDSFRSVLLTPFPRRLVGARRGSVSSLLLWSKSIPCGGPLQTTTRHGRGHQLAFRRSGAPARRRRDGSPAFREATDWPAAPWGRAMVDQRLHLLGYRGFPGSSGESRHERGGAGSRSTGSRRASEGTEGQ